MQPLRECATRSATRPIGGIVPEPGRRAPARTPGGRRAGRGARRAAGRPDPPVQDRGRAPPSRDTYNYSRAKPLRRVDASRSASIAMDYVDQYGPVILGRVAPERWPVYVALGTVQVPRGHSRAGRGGAGDPGDPGGSGIRATRAARAIRRPGGPGRSSGGEILVAADASCRATATRSTLASAAGPTRTRGSTSSGP